MSMYTTGEVAKLCGVSVRTVQYYDSRSILIPSELSEGGRRLYSENDLRRMRIICFLRDIGMPINDIRKLFSEEKPQNAISLLLEQQEHMLTDELNERETMLARIADFKREIRNVSNFSIESIGDIAHYMKNKKKLNRMRWLMIIIGTPISVLQLVSIILWITNGTWWPFLLWIGLAVVFGVWVSRYHFDHTAYICPECHEEFTATFKEVFWANHTPKMRRLTCPKCGIKRFCVEVYASRKD